MLVVYVLNLSIKRESDVKMVKNIIQISFRISVRFTLTSIIAGYVGYCYAHLILVTASSLLQVPNGMVADYKSMRLGVLDLRVA